MFRFDINNKLQKIFFENHTPLSYTVHWQTEKSAIKYLRWDKRKGDKWLFPLED